MTICLPLALGEASASHKASHPALGTPSLSQPTSSSPSCATSNRSSGSGSGTVPSSPLSPLPPTPPRPATSRSYGGLESPSEPAAGKVVKKRKRPIAAKDDVDIQPSSQASTSTSAAQSPDYFPTSSQTTSNKTSEAANGKPKQDRPPKRSEQTPNGNPWDGFGRVPDDVPYGLARVGEAVRDARRIIVITGAGISTPAIPDFRSATGLFKTLAATANADGGGGADVSSISSGKELFDVKCLTNPDLIPLHHTLLNSLHQLSTAASPSTFHSYLHKADVQGRLLRVYTQNIDGLERKAGLDCRIPEEGSVGLRNRLERKRGLGGNASGLDLEGKGGRQKLSGSGIIEGTPTTTDLARIQDGTSASGERGSRPPADDIHHGAGPDDDCQWISAHESEGGMVDAGQPSSVLTPLPSPWDRSHQLGPPFASSSAGLGHGASTAEGVLDRFRPESPFPDAAPALSQGTGIPSMSPEDAERQITESTPQPHSSQLTDCSQHILQDDSPKSDNSAETTVSTRWRMFESPGAAPEERLLAQSATMPPRPAGSVGPTLPRCIPLHGMLSHLQCTRCSYTVPLEQCLPLPMEMIPCPTCSTVREERIDERKRPRSIGFLRASVVLYGEEHKHGESIGSIVESDMLGRSKEDGRVDLVIVAGTTLQIPGVKRMIKEFARVVKSSRPSREEKAAARRLAEDEADETDSDESDEENETRRARRVTRAKLREQNANSQLTDQDDNEEYPIRTILLNRDPPSKGKTGEWSDVFDVWVQGDLQNFIQRHVINGPTPLRTRSRNPLRTYFYENVDAIRAQAKKRRICLGPTVSLTLGDGFANLLPTHLSQLNVQVKKSAERKLSIRFTPKAIEQIHQLDVLEAATTRGSEDAASEILDSESEIADRTRRGKQAATSRSAPRSHQGNLNTFLTKPTNLSVKARKVDPLIRKDSATKSRARPIPARGSKELLNFAPAGKWSDPGDADSVKKSRVERTEPSRDIGKHASTNAGGNPPTPSRAPAVDLISIPSTPKRQIKRSAKASVTPKRNKDRAMVRLLVSELEASAVEIEEGIMSKFGAGRELNFPCTDADDSQSSVSDADSMLSDEDVRSTLAVIGLGPREDFAAPTGFPHLFLEAISSNALEERRDFDDAMEERLGPSSGFGRWDGKGLDVGSNGNGVEVPWRAVLEARKRTRRPSASARGAPPSSPGDDDQQHQRPKRAKQETLTIIPQQRARTSPVRSASPSSSICSSLTSVSGVADADEEERGVHADWGRQIGMMDVDLDVSRCMTFKISDPVPEQVDSKGWEGKGRSTVPGSDSIIATRSRKAIGRPVERSDLVSTPRLKLSPSGNIIAPIRTTRLRSAATGSVVAKVEARPVDSKPRRRTTLTSGSSSSLENRRSGRLGGR